MPQKEKGIYPNWISDGDIINLVLNEITKEKGKLPYTYVVNPNHSKESQERMKMILARMQKEKLLLSSNPENGFLEIDIEGGMAVHLGYRKYKMQKRWGDIIHMLRRFYLFFFILFTLAFVAGLVYFVLHSLKKI
jgi:hypothetical protein